MRFALTCALLATAVVLIFSDHGLGAVILAVAALVLILQGGQ